MNIFRKITYRARDFLIRPLLEQNSLSFPYSDTACQLQLKFTYKALAESGNKLPTLNEVGFKVLSQTDEDGILLYIFSVIGTESKKSVEICAGNGIECNTANFII